MAYRFISGLPVRAANSSVIKPLISAFFLTAGSSAVMFGSSGHAHANCLQFMGFVTCAADDNDGFNDTGGAAVTSFTVNDNVTVENGGIAIDIQDNDATTIDTFTIGTGAQVTSTSNSAIDLDNAVTNFTNNGTITGGNASSAHAVNAVNTTTNVASEFNNNGILKTTATVSAHGMFLVFSAAPLATINNNAGAVIDASAGSGRGITAFGAGILGETGYIINNSGTISGGQRGIGSFLGNDVITNASTGVIEVGNPVRTVSSDNAIDTKGGDDTVINNGILRSLNGGQASIFNRETVDLGNGDDVFEVQPNSQIIAMDGMTAMKGTVDGSNDTDLLRFGGTGDGTFDLGDIDTGARDKQYQNFENFSVINGTWTFTGTTNQDFTLDGGTVMGTGTFGNVTANNGATIAPGNSIGTINTGDLNLTAGSILLIEVSQTGADQVNVTGAVTIANGAILQVDDLAPALQDATQTFIIINNDGGDAVTGTFGTITDNLAFLKPQVSTTAGDGNDVELSFVVDTPADNTNTVTNNPNVVFGTFSTNTGNQGNVGQALTGLDTTPGSLGAELRDKLLVLSTDQALQAYTDLSGDVHSSTNHNFFDVSNQLGNALGGRFANLQSFGAAGSQAFNSSISAYQSIGSTNTQAADAITNEFADDDANLGAFWGSVTGHYSKLDGNGNGVGTQNDGFGFVTGFDRKVDIGTTIGIAGGYASSNVDTQNGSSALDVESLSLSLYGVHTQGDFNLNGFLAYTHHDIEGLRNIRALGLAANSDYSADQFTAQLEASYRIQEAHENTDVLPFIIGRYVNVDTDSFTETGAGGANLIVSGNSQDAFDLTTGIRFETVTDNSKMYVSGGYQHRFGDVAPDNTYTFAGGGTFTAQGVERSRSSGFVEAGLETQLKENVTFFANGAANLGSDYEAYSGNVGIRLTF